MNGKELEMAVKLDNRSATQIAKELKISRTQLYDLFKVSSFTPNYLKKFEEINLKLTKLDTQTSGKPVPVYDIDFTASDVTQFSDFPEKIIGYIDLAGFKKCIAFVKVRGNSMFPTFTAGDIIGLEPMEDITIIEYGQPFGVVTKSGQSLIKTIRKGKDADNLILRSNNKEFDDIDIHKNQIEKLYKAHGPIRDSHY